MTNKNILIVGASGFVGSALTNALLETDNKLFLVSRNTSFERDGATVYHGDVSDPSFNEKILKDIDVVYYLASYKKNIAVHTSKPYEVASGNVGPLISFLEVLKNSNVSDFVYMSSSLVAYANDESDRIDGYVLGKYMNEQLLNAFRNETDMNVRIVRSTAMYGVGDSFDKEKANFIPATIMKTDEATSSIEVWGTGARELQFIYIDDVIRNLLEVCNSDEQFYILGNSEAVSVKDIVVMIGEIMEKKLEMVFDTTKPDKPTKLIDFKNIVEPNVDMETGLKKVIEYYLKNHD